MWVGKGWEGEKKNILNQALGCRKNCRSVLFMTRGKMDIKIVENSKNPLEQMTKNFISRSGSALRTRR